MRNHRFDVWGALALAIVAAVLLLAMMAQARAHAWYAGYCCNEHDCRPAEAGEVTVTNIGYKVRGFSEEIPWDHWRIRQIPKEHEDGKYHVCIMRGEAGQPYLRCLYVPRPSNSF